MHCASVWLLSGPSTSWVQFSSNETSSEFCLSWKMSCKTKHAARTRPISCLSARSASRSGFWFKGTFRIRKRFFTIPIVLSTIIHVREWIWFFLGSSFLNWMWDHHLIAERISCFSNYRFIRPDFSGKLVSKFRKVEDCFVISRPGAHVEWSNFCLVINHNLCIDSWISVSSMPFLTDYNPQPSSIARIRIGNWTKAL